MVPVAMKRQTGRLPVGRVSGWLGGLVAGLVFLALLAGVANAGPLQDMIDAAAPGDTLSPAPGVYYENLVISKAITLDGSRGAVTIDAGGTGTVLLLETDGATLKGLVLRNSGSYHNNIDSGVQVRGNFNVIRDLVIENCLFGIDMQMSNNNIVKRNTITSTDLSLHLRGDGIRLWYSMENKILDNRLDDIRDVVIWYSRGNKIIGNWIHGGRYGIHFMYSQFNLVENNDIGDGSVGIFLMYSDSVEVRGNRISRASGASGIGIGFKETSDIKVIDNDILGNAVGVYLDVSPYQPESTNVFSGNRIAYNGIGIEFHNDWHGNIFADNDFVSNFTQVAVRGGGTARNQDWAGNYWDDYGGFDRDQNGVGDSPFEIYNYADRLWMDVPPVAFFRAAPALELLDFVERLAPFTEPLLLLQDNNPAVSELALLARDDDAAAAN